MTTLPQTQRQRRGHSFYPPKSVKVPALYSGEDIEMADKKIVLHYFVAGSDWYITEADLTTGQAFGFCCPMGWQDGEWGYVDLRELEEIKVAGWLVIDRDCWWKPITFSELAASR